MNIDDSKHYPRPDEPYDDWNELSLKPLDRPGCSHHAHQGKGCIELTRGNKEKRDAYTRTERESS